MLKRFGRLTKIEKIAVAFLGVLVLFTGIQIGYAFVLEHTQTFPKKGGIYVEGASGKIEAINPLFIHYGSLTHDLSLLVFSGLTKFDPKTKDIVPDLATFTVSDDGKTHTYTLNDKAQWHDGEPVTSNDVVFTYQTVLQNPSFKGSILNYNDFSGTKVFKIDAKTVKFVLEKPDSFFPVKTIVGLLPEHILGPVPPESLGQDPFNQSPIGTGPYRFVSMVPNDNLTEITLQSFEGYVGEQPHIPTLQFRISPTAEEALKIQGDVDGLRTVPDDAADKILQGGHLNLIRYNLPQYVALFLNNDSPTLKARPVRLALQLGTDKSAIADALGQTQIIDTPLLEINQKNWVYQYNISKANGSLHDSEWQLPEPATGSAAATPTLNPAPSTPVAEPVADPDNTSAVTFIAAPNGGRDWETTDTKVTLSGTAPAKTKSIFVDDYELKKFIPGDPGWSYVTSLEFGNLKTGQNVFRVYAVDFTGNKKEIDSITIAQGTSLEFSEKELDKIKRENAEAIPLPTRLNKKGEELVLRLIAPEQPQAYGKIAELVQEQWKKLGVKLLIQVLPNDTFQQRMAKRDYDLLIFGQNLGYNLDAYPYWHSSQAKQGGYNLSQFKNFAVDSLLEKARLQSDREQRQKTLNDIQEIMSKEAPAVFLYSPTYLTALSSKIQNAAFDNMATLSDRFSRISDWYAGYDRQFKKGTNFLTLFSWLGKQF